MRCLTLTVVACASFLTACASKPPVAYCPYPPIPSSSVVLSLIGDTKGELFLNKYKKHLCKYWNVYDKEEYEENCIENIND